MSTNKPPPEYIDPLDWSTVDDVVEVTAEPIPTGLSVEDDAKRILVIEFGACFCPNCETYYDKELVGTFCPYCVWRLKTIDTKPLKRKR